MTDERSLPQLVWLQSTVMEKTFKTPDNLASNLYDIK